LYPVFIAADGESLQDGSFRLNGLLLDENLPYRLRFPVGLPIIHSTDLGKSFSDTDLWNYSKENGLVIVTKDADFSDRIAVADPPPWVIHVRFGNVRGKLFDEFFDKHWAKIFELLPAYKLINVYYDSIEALS
jgi:predicted nuclease of predicted toxin-antitoxin system